MSYVSIQIQDTTGNWFTCQRTPNNSQMIYSAMKELQANYPNFRVRAVDDNGRVIDIF